MYRRYLGNFTATITDPRTGEARTYTHDTLDELKERLKWCGIKRQNLAGPARTLPKYITLTAVERAWLGMTVVTDLGQGEVFSMGPWPKTLWVILDDPNPLAIHYQHARSTDRMVCLRDDQCQKVSSWRLRAEPLPLILD